MDYRQKQMIIGMIAESAKNMGGAMIGSSISNKEITVTISVDDDLKYIETRKIMSSLQNQYGGEIEYHDYWSVDDEGVIGHSQATLCLEVA